MNDFTQDNILPTDHISFPRWRSILDDKLEVPGEVGTWRNGPREAKASLLGASDVRLELNPLDKTAGGAARVIVARHYRCSIEGALQAAKDVQKFLITDTLPEDG